MRLRPASYVAYKTGLLSDQLLRAAAGPGRPAPPPRAYPAGLDKQHRRQLLSFLVTAGWLTPSLAA